jgi:thioredoxin reductase (NADPH)
MMHTEEKSMLTADNKAFAKLTTQELELLTPFAVCQVFNDGDIVFRAGDENVDVFVVESGAVAILNPNNGNSEVTVHHSGQFSGDIDVLTRRPIIVTGVAQGETRVLRVPNARLREALTKVPNLSEKLVTAFQRRRELLAAQGNVGLTVVGPAKCRETTELREFLHKNFVPFMWQDSRSDEGKEIMANLGVTTQLPVVRCMDGTVLRQPTLRELAVGSGVWRECPSRQVDLAIIGAGPAGLCAAVYAASEGLSTIVLDRLGPGGQAAGTSRIENFIGFPSGLSGTDFATRAVLQMLKFGANLVAPVVVTAIESGERQHRLSLDCGATISAKTVLIATGVRWRKLNAEGADRFERAGVYYACTSIEALLHDREPVAVVGSGNSAGQAAVYLAECCSTRKVHLIVRSTLGPRMSEYLHSRIRGNSNIVLHERSQITAVHGARSVDSITVKRYDDQIEQLDVNAVFVFIGSDPSAEFLPDSIARDDQGFVMTGADVLGAERWPLRDRNPCPLETSVPGILAAGDIRSGATKRVGFAVGDGTQAVACVHKLLSIYGGGVN